MKKQLATILILFPILLFAQWPTEPYTGLQLTNDTEHYEYIKAYCQDGEGGYYVCIENEGCLYINHIDLYGNIRWPIGYPPEECFTDQDPGWQYEGPKRDNVIMTCDSNGTVWVAWEDYRDSYTDDWGYASSSDIYIQKFNQDRIAQWNSETGLLVQAHVNPSSDPNVSDHRFPNHLEPQNDGSVILIWGDGNEPAVSYTGNKWAQRFGSDGNPIWEQPGIRMIPNEEYIPAWNFYYHSDGIGGILFTYENIPLRLLPTGELAWEFGAVEIEEIIRPRDICAGYDNTIVIIGDGRRQAGEEDLCYATVVDTSGNFVHGPTSIGNPEHDFSGSYVGKTGYSSYSVIGMNNDDLTYYSLDPSLNMYYEPTVIDTNPVIRPIDETLTISRVGYRMISKQQIGYANTHMETFGYDTLGHYFYRHKLDEDNNNVWRPRLDVDPSGNTWVFWTRLEPNDDIYINVISPEGVWGIASNGVDSPNKLSVLPSDISLHVYPNPGNGQFNISFDLVDPSPATFILTNVLGQRVYSFELPRNAVASGLPGANRSGQINLNLNDQASGTYFLQVRTESGQVQQRRILLVK